MVTQDCRAIKFSGIQSRVGRCIRNAHGSDQPAWSTKERYLPHFGLSFADSARKQEYFTAIACFAPDCASSSRRSCIDQQQVQVHACSAIEISEESSALPVMLLTGISSFCVAADFSAKQRQALRPLLLIVRVIWYVLLDLLVRKLKLMLQ